jgi:hypothetical protein
VTVRSWSDPDVCNPVPLSPETARLYAVDFPRPSGEGGPLFRHGHQKNYRGDPAPLLFYDPLNGDRPQPGMGPRLASTRWIEIVAGASQREHRFARVLQALVTDLEGFLLVERRRDLLPSGRGAVPPLREPRIGVLVDHLLRYRCDGRDDVEDECGLLYRALPFWTRVEEQAASRGGAVVDELWPARTGSRRPESRGSTTRPRRSARSAAGPSSTCSSTGSSSGAAGGPRRRSVLGRRRIRQPPAGIADPAPRRASQALADVSRPTSIRTSI